MNREEQIAQLIAQENDVEIGSYSFDPIWVKRDGKWVEVLGLSKRNILSGKPTT